MSIEILSVSGTDLIPGKFLKRWQSNRERPDEIVNIKKAASLTTKEQAKLHDLQIDGRDIGFVTVDIHQLPKVNPCKYYLQVAFLFVSKQYRKVNLDALEGLTASEYLMSTVFNKAMDAAGFFPFSNIVLYPAGEKLIPFYTSIGYSMLARIKGFMFLPLRAEA